MATGPHIRLVRARLAPLLAFLAAVCIAASGCGGGSDDPAAADMPEPRTYTAFAEHVAQLIAEAEDRGDCARLAKIDQRSAAELPCPAPEALRERMDSFELADNGLFMNDRAGVVDYRSGEGGAESSMVLLLDFDQKWTVQRLDVNPKRPPANARGDGDANLRRAMLRYERAVRKRDCEQIARLTYRPEGTPQPSCKQQLAATAGLATVLRADAGQRPSYNGGNEDFSFYSLTTYHPKAAHHTLTAVQTMIAGEKRFLVSDIHRDE